MPIINSILVKKGGDPTPPVVVENWVKFTSDTPMTITPKYTKSGVTLQYSLDLVTWTNIAHNTATSSASIIYFRGQATNDKGLFVSSGVSTNRWQFSGALSLKVYGDLQYLLCDNFGDVVAPKNVVKRGFADMFMNCSVLTEFHAKLSADTIGEECYYQTFKNCPMLSIITTEITVTDLAGYCFQNMFQDCSGLLVGPKLKFSSLATTSCYKMFSGCNSLRVLYLDYTGIDTDPNTNYWFGNWVAGITTGGVLLKRGTLFTESGDNTYPTTWTQIAWV